MAFKQVILVRMDLRLPKGKLAVQVAHASVGCVLKSERRVVDEWLGEGGKKVVLKVADAAELERYRVLAGKEKLVTALIRDAGLTVVPPGTVTCLGIGPDDEKKVDRITGMLKMV